jgi:hypothetical protein
MDRRAWIVIGVFFLTIGVSGIRRSEWTTLFSGTARTFMVIGATATVAGVLYRKQ